MFWCCGVLLCVLCALGCVLGCWVVSMVCGVCGTNDLQHGESVLARANYAPNWVAEHLGASSRRPLHPEPSTTKNSSSSRAEKWALTSMRTECEKCRKMRQKPPSDVIKELIEIMSRFLCANRAGTRIDLGIVLHVENMKFFQKHPKTDAEYVSTVESRRYGNRSGSHLQEESIDLYTSARRTPNK